MNIICNINKKYLILSFLPFVQLSLALENLKAENTPFMEDQILVDQEGVKTMLDLPVELWHHVASYLGDLKTYYNISLTSKLFYSGLSPVILTHICKRQLVYDLKNPSTFVILDHLSKHAKNHNIPVKLKVVNVVSCPDLQKILSMHSKITELDLSDNNFSGSRLAVVLENKKVLNNLVKLKLSNCLLDTDNIKDFVCSKSGVEYNKLSMLDISHNKIGNTFCEYIEKSSAFPMLRELDLTATSLDKVGLTYLRQSTIGKKIMKLKYELNYIPTHFF